jgi:hypothetical protein
MLQIRLLNCFWLLIPILLWNLIFTPRLQQEGYRSDTGISRGILILEHALRIFVFVFPLFLPFQIADVASKIGLVLYVVGILVYCGSWIPVLYRPDARWSRSAAGLLAPYYTPLPFLAGIGLIGHSWIYVVFSGLFIAIHVWHGVRSFGLLASGNPM